MRKQFINFEDEEANTMQFMQKLKKFKTVSKDLKTKNIITAHKVEWNKEYANLLKQEKDLSKDMEISFQEIDKNLLDKIQQSDLFLDEKHHSFSEFYNKSNEQREMFDLNIWYQVQNFRSLVKDKLLKKQQKPNDNINLEDFKQLKTDIKEFIKQMNQITEEEYEFLYVVHQQQEKQNQINHQKQSSNTIFPQIKNQGNSNSNKNNNKNENPITDAIQNTNNHIKSQNQSMGQLENTGNILEDIEDEENPQDNQILITEQKKKFSVENDEEILDMISYFNVTQSLDQEEQKLYDSYKKAQSLLEERYKLEFLRLENDYEQFKTVDLPDFIQKNNKNAHIFMHIFKTYIKKGKDRDFYMERLQLQFPKVSKKYLEIVDQIIQKNQYKQQKFISIQRNYISEKKQLKLKAEEQVLSLLNIRIEESKNINEKLKTQSEQLRIQEELEERRNLFEEKKRIREIEEKINKENEEKEEKIRLEKWEKHTKEQKQKAGTYVATKEQKLAEEEKLKQLEQEKKKYEQELQILQNKPKVSERQQVENLKIQEKIVKKEQQIQIKQQKEERINDAIESYQFRPNVEMDSNRLNKQTVSGQQKKLVQYDKADKIELTKVHGYSENQLMKDMRYRLSSALADAGVAQTNYAHNVMNYLSKVNE